VSVDHDHALVQRQDVGWNGWRLGLRHSREPEAARTADDPCVRHFLHRAEPLVEIPLGA
jgi:hypothetical protein